MTFKLLSLFIVLIAFSCLNYAAPLDRPVSVNKRDFGLGDDLGDIGDIFDKREDEPEDSPEDIRDDLMEKREDEPEDSPEDIRDDLKEKRDFGLGDDLGDIGDIFDKREDEPEDSPEDIRDDLMENR